MIKVVTFQNFRFFNNQDDCFVLRRIAGESTIKIALPFHEDTPNFDLTISEALDLRNAIDQLVGIKLLGNGG